MSQNYTTYTTATGVIIKSGICMSGKVADQAGAGETSIEGASTPKEDYVLAGVITPRPALGSSIDKTSVTADGIDKAVISGIPTGCAVTAIITSMSTVGNITDGFCDLTFTVTGTYLIYVTGENLLTENYTVTAT